MHKWNEAFPSAAHQIDSAHKHLVYQAGQPPNVLVIVKHPLAWVRSLWRYLLYTGRGGKPQGQAYSAQTYHEARTIEQFIRGNNPIQYWAERHASWLYDIRIKRVEVVQHIEFVREPRRLFQRLAAITGYPVVSHVSIGEKHSYYSGKKFDPSYYIEERWRGELSEEAVDLVRVGLIGHDGVARDLGYDLDAL